MLFKTFCKKNISMLRQHQVMKNFSKIADFKITGCLSVLRKGMNDDNNLNFSAVNNPVMF